MEPIIKRFQLEENFAEITWNSDNPEFLLPEIDISGGGWTIEQMREFAKRILMTCDEIEELKKKL